MLLGRDALACSRRDAGQLPTARRGPCSRGEEAEDLRGEGEGEGESSEAVSAAARPGEEVLAERVAVGEGRPPVPLGRRCIHRGEEVDQRAMRGEDEDQHCG